MKVIKRDGRVVDYNKEKIAKAIEKANQEVRAVERATEEDIKEIIKYIEELNKKRILVEDIQDIIEEQLMEKKRFELAKKYIVYRYTRALVRKQNTTDESILGLIRNGNKELSTENLNKRMMIASIQRDYIAGEVSKDLTNRLLLPEKIVNAHQEGMIYFHASNYFAQPIFNSSLINIQDMLDNGTVINGILIESPKSFQVACIVTAQIIATVANNQYGEQTIDIKYLGKYLRKSYEKYKKEMQEKYNRRLTKDAIEELVNDRVEAELKAGIQAIQYQINTLVMANEKAKCVTFFFNFDENDLYKKENKKIIEEILKQKNEGMKNEAGENITPKFPRLIYSLDGKEKYKYEGKFNQGVVSINLPQIGIIAEKEEEKFWKLLDDRLELCKEALMCRHYALLGTKSDISPIHWQYGAIARLGKGEKIDKYLYNGNSTLSLGYVGLNEMAKLITGASITSNEGKEFALKVIKHLKEKITQWKKETNIGFTLYDAKDDEACYNLAQIDKEKYGIITNITDKEQYTNV